MKKWIKHIIIATLVLFGYIILAKYHGCVQHHLSGQSCENTNIRFFEENTELFREAILNILTSMKFNGNIYLSREGKIIFDNSFGFADYRSSEPLNKESVFQLASITKTFTATAILMLQEDSLLNINDKVILHIPGFPYNDITIRHLLMHTSGLQNYMYLIERHWVKKNLPTNEDVLDLFIEHSLPLNFSPGTKFKYSNTGYVFLALLIERISGQTYSGFLEERIFRPLDLQNTFVYNPRNPQLTINRAYGFRKSGNNWRIIPEDNLDAISGDKGIFSNVTDLLKWDAAFYSDKLIPNSVMEEAFEFSKLCNDSIIEYGYGWRLQDVFGIKAVHHPGRWRGFRTSFKRFIDRQTTLIILSNNNTDIADLVDTLQALLFTEEREAWLAEKKLLEINVNDSISSSLDYQ